MTGALGLVNPNSKRRTGSHGDRMTHHLKILSGFIINFISQVNSHKPQRSLPQFSQLLKKKIYELRQEN